MFSLSLLLLAPLITFFVVFDSIPSNIDEVVSINPSANVFVFGDFYVHQKDWPNYSGGTDRPDELCYNFLCYDLRRSYFRFLSFFWQQYCSSMAFPPLGYSDRVVVSVSIDFPSNSQHAVPFHRRAYDYGVPFERCSLGGYL